MKTIEIDVDVNASIEAARRDFSESSNAILRRLLGIRSPEASKTASGSSIETQPQAGWRGVHRKSKKEVFLPNGTELRAKYGRAYVFGEVKSGRIFVNGSFYDAVSPALHENVSTKDGAPVSLNGWAYWEAKRPGESEFRPIASI